MGRLTENECMDLWAESLQDDVKKLKSEVARLQAEAVQLRHRLAERADAHDRLHERAERMEAERDAIIGLCVRKGDTNRGLWWDLVGITGQTEPFNQVRVAAGLDAAPAGEKEGE